MKHVLRSSLGLALSTTLSLVVGAMPASAWALDRTTSYTYNSQGLVETANGPRTDVSDITTYGYDIAGHLTKVTNALGHITTLANYDVTGKAKTITDANGVVSTLAYTPQGWLQSVTRAGYTTQYSYNDVGDITQVQLGDGSTLTYTWDGARRVTAIGNNLGEKIEYDLDAMGNRTAQRTKDGTGTLTQKHQWLYDELGRLLRSIGAAEQNQRQQYDLNGNPTVSTTPRNDSSTDAYDAVNRLVSSTNPLNGVTAYEYDGQDNLTKVQDPRGVTTRYQYDGLGNLTQQISPDSGTSTFVHDAAGNITQKTDARGVVTTYSYDALNRITARRYPSKPELDVTYAYDMTTDGNKGVGHMTAQMDGSGLISFIYDERGNLISQSRSVAVSNVQRIENLNYSYDAANRLSGIGYPGFMVTYPRNGAGQVTGVNLAIGTQAATSIASSISYMPFGPLKKLTWGNGIQLTRQYDQDYQLTQQNVGSWQSAYSFDANGNIASRNHSLFGALNYSYDAMDRLTDVNATASRTAYTYDANGNRKTRYRYTTTDGKETRTAVQVLTTASDSNRLTADSIYPITQDAAGNTLQLDNSSKTFVYDEQGRMSQVVIDGLVRGEYTYNGMGQRTQLRSYLSSGLEYSITYLYGPDGQVLGRVRYNNLGKISLAQYWIWLDGMPLAGLEFRYNTNGAVSGTYLYYLHADHLNTPRLATSQSQTLLWTWDSDEFGINLPKTDVDGDGVALDVPLRFPGQLFDAHSQMHYNYFRDYDQNRGRYMESDPIGLVGGSNTYVYVESNPLNFFDILGLIVCFDEDAPGIEKLKKDYEDMKKTQHGLKIATQLESRPERYVITSKEEDGTLMNKESYYNGPNRAIRIDPNFGLYVDTAIGRQQVDGVTTMAHEVGHAATKEWDEMKNVNNNENPVRRELGLPDRTSYNGYEKP